MNTNRFRKVQNHTFITSAALFFTVSAAGYLWEVLIYLFMNGTFTNRGFFHGPWLPVYGLGAVLLALCLYLLPRRLRAFPFAVFLFSACVCTVTEYMLALYLDKYRGVRYWDYSGWPLSIRGRVCLVSFLFFGFGGLFLDQRLLPAMRRLSGRIFASRALRVLLGVLCVLFTADFIYSCAHPNAGANIAERIR